MFLTLEGMEGAGKSTLRDNLANHYTACGHNLVLTREPGGSELGAAVRSIVLHAASHLCADAEVFLFLADRAQHVHEHIAPALAAGKTVLCDRYADSTIVYQGYGRGLDPDTLYRLNDAAVKGLWPDVTLLLDLPPIVGLERARKRNAVSGLTEAEGRFEAEALAFHTRVREGFVAWAGRHPERFIILDATRPPEALTADTLAALARRGLA